MESLYALFRLCREAHYLEADNHASFAVFSQKDTLYILFEQSNGPHDWMNNLDFPAAPYREMETDWRCHRGFLRVWRSVQPYIRKILSQTAFQKITVAGYSHGGALAVLCHEYIWYTEPSRRATLHGVGFGPPRVVVCRNSCRRITSRWEQFTVVCCHGDPVPLLPPRFLGYRHMGHILTLGKKERYASVDAHRPEHYLQLLAEREKITDSFPPFHA